MKKATKDKAAEAREQAGHKKEVGEKEDQRREGDADGITLSRSHPIARQAAASFAARD